MKSFKELLEENIDFPFNRQVYNYTCGASVVQSIMSYYGYDLKEIEIADELETTTAKGTKISSIKKFLDKRKIKYEELLNQTPDDLKALLSKGYPVLMLVQAWTNKKNVDWKKNWEDGHYVIAMGFEDGREKY